MPSGIDCKDLVPAVTSVFAVPQAWHVWASAWATGSGVGGGGGSAVTVTVGGGAAVVDGVGLVAARVTRVVMVPAMIAPMPAAAAIAGQRRWRGGGAGGYGCGGHVG
ncbi:MAG: hypothetical protein SV966_01365 [Actinomycetota bacterium]|nr:hypothetical protein [Actinomycetota bacterium]